jgi:DNA repair protein RecO (recombination protein O)
MSAPRDYQVEGIVIRYAVVGERDKLVTLLTPDRGKVSALAKSARRPGSSLGPCLETLSHGRYHCVTRRSTDLIVQAESLDSFPSLMSDLWRTSCGLYVAELIDATTVEGTPGRAVFGLLLSVLKEIDNAGCDDTVLRYFELRLLDALGFCPSLKRCVHCGAVLQPVENGLSSSLGGVVCSDCMDECRDAHLLSVDALKVMRFWLGSDLATARRVKASQALTRELDEQLHRFVIHIVQRELKSRSWLARLRTEMLLTSNP